MKQAIKTTLKRTPLFAAYSRMRDQRIARQLEQSFWATSELDDSRQAFYRQFIAPGATVFDVGANFGNRSKLFWRLDANVVAVEPQPPCADFLQRVFEGKGRFQLIRKALGAQSGQAEMLVSDAHTISSLSAEWVRAVNQSGRFPSNVWSHKMTVEVDTLDHLIDQISPNQRPAFVKIDVEGFEEEVVKGLSKPVGALSMEFTHEFRESMCRCVAHLNGLGSAQFQMSMDESMVFVFPTWTSAASIQQALMQLPPLAWGDLYARFE